MKKLLLASAFALFGTFAMANENNTELDETSLDAEFLAACVPVSVSRCNYTIEYLDCTSSNALELVKDALDLYDDMEVLCD